LEFSGALYHITSRGDRRENIYESAADFKAFLSILADVCQAHHWLCHGYCLMDNHYHLLIETPEANLAKGMRQLNGVYTQAFNRAHGRVGHVFQGRYKAILVEKQSYLLELSRYIVLNPVRAGMVRSVRDWRWSSYRAMVGQVQSPAFLCSEWILSTFAKRKATSVARYKAFVAAGKGQPSPWGALRNQVFLGDDSFVASMQSLIDGDKALSEISPRRALPRSLSDYELGNDSRNSAIVEAYASGGYTLKNIGDYFGLHYSTVSGLVKNHKSKT
jgi:REP element-mobilizing transposase RayT